MHHPHSPGFVVKVILVHFLAATLTLFKIYTDIYDNIAWRNSVVLVSNLLVISSDWQLY
jgi:hypothetical protein